MGDGERGVKERTDNFGCVEKEKQKFENKFSKLQVLENHNNM